MEAKEIAAANIGLLKHIQALMMGNGTLSIRCFPEVFDTTEKALTAGLIEGDILSPDENGMIGGTFTLTKKGVAAMATLTAADPTIRQKK